MTTMTNDGKNVVLTAIGVALSGGSLVIATEANAEVATLVLNSGSGNALNTPSGGATTYKAITQDSDATGGEAAKFDVKTSGGTALYSGTVTAEGDGGDFEIDDCTIAAHDVVRVGEASLSM